jgi:glycine cleavage system H protein
MKIKDYELIDDLLYDKKNNWVRIEGETATFGITDVGVKLAREMAYVELPKPGSMVSKGKACGTVESAKWAGEIVAPISGTVTEVNLSLNDEPSAMNKDPYGKGWIAKIKLSNPGEKAGLLNVTQAADWVQKEVIK